MSDLDQIVRDSLERLVRARPDARPDWGDVLRRSDAHRRRSPVAWLRVRSRRRATWIVALAALAVVAAGALAARSLLDGADPGVANTVDPTVAQRLAREPALARAPWLASRGGRLARIGEVGPRPSLVFAAGVDRQEALQLLYEAVSERGRLPVGARLGPPLPEGRIVAYPADEAHGIRIDLRAPFGYDPSNGTILTPVLIGVAGAVAPAPGPGSPLPIGAQVEPPGPADCQVLDPRRPSPPCTIAATPATRPPAPEVRLGPPRTAAVDTPVDMHVADLDRDGFPEVLAPSALSGGVSVVRVERGVLAGATRVPAPEGAIAVTELTGDRIPDLAVAGHGLAVLEGVGDGRFRSWARASVLPAHAEPHAGPPSSNLAVSLAPADLNGDGRPELVVWAATAARLWSFATDAGGGLHRVAGVSVPEQGLFSAPFPGVGPGRLVAAGDLTGDDRDDVAVATGESVLTLVASEGGRLERGAELSLPGGVAQVECADLNRDGRADLVMLGRLATGVAISRPDGGLDLTLVLKHPEAAIGGVAAGDVTGDGQPDLALADTRSHAVTVLAGDGNGGFGDAVELPAGNEPTAVVVADMNADGRRDLLVASDFHSAVSLRRGLGPAVLAP
jgi:hypothetical protein